MLEDNRKTSFRLYMVALFFVLGGLVTMAVLPVLVDARVVDDVAKPRGFVDRFTARIADAVTFDNRKQAYLDLVRAADDRARAHEMLCAEDLTDRDRSRIESYVDAGLSRAERVSQRVGDVQEAIVLSGVGVREEHAGQTWDAQRFTQEAADARTVLQSYQRALQDNSERQVLCGFSVREERAQPSAEDTHRDGGEVEMIPEFELVELEGINLIDVRTSIENIEQDERFHPALRAYVSDVKVRLQERIDAGETIRTKTLRRIISNTVPGR